MRFGHLHLHSRKDHFRGVAARIKATRLLLTIKAITRFYLHLNSYSNLHFFFVWIEAYDTWFGESVSFYMIKLGALLYIHRYLSTHMFAVVFSVYQKNQSARHVSICVFSLRLTYNIYRFYFSFIKIKAAFKSFFSVLCVYVFVSLQ
jgi:hypothetical protein